MLKKKKQQQTVALGRCNSLLFAGYLLFGKADCVFHFFLLVTLGP